MTFGHLFLLFVLLVIVILVVAYLRYRWKRNQYKRWGYWDLSDIEYFDSVLEVLYCSIAGGVIAFLLYFVITNWNMPICTTH